MRDEVDEIGLNRRGRVRYDEIEMGWGSIYLDCLKSDTHPNEPLTRVC